MKGSYKQFDPILFASNDERARAAVVDYLNGQGVYCQPADDKYGPDLAVYTGYKHKYFIECEIKLVWRADQDIFPWGTVQIPERKLKYIKSTTKDVQFWILRSDCQYAVIIEDHVVSSSPITIIPNRLVAEGEAFVQVPIEQCNIVRLV